MAIPRSALLGCFGCAFMALSWTVGAAQGTGSSAPDALSAVSNNGHAVASATAAQTATIFGLADIVEKLHLLQAARGAGATPSTEERMIRFDLLEAIETATLQIDDVLGEISNERNQLGDLRTALQVRRDKTVVRLTTAALLTGSALGTAVTATQFSGLGTTAQNTGDGIGIGGGVASTLLSIQAARKQAGPRLSGRKPQYAGTPTGRKTRIEHKLPIPGARLFAKRS